MLICLFFNIWLSGALLKRFAQASDFTGACLFSYPHSIFHCSSRAGCYAGRHWGCSRRLQGTAPLSLTNQCKVKAKCSFIILQLSFLRKWDLNKLCCECLSPFPPTHPQWFWTSRHISNTLDREVSKVLQITHSMKIYARLRGKSQLKPTRKKLRKRTLLLDFGKPSWEKAVGNNASLPWQLRELLVSPNFMIITEYAYKLPPLNCLLCVGLEIQLLRFLIHEEILL